MDRGNVERVPSHVALIAGDGGPEIGMVEAMPDRAEAARRFAEASVTPGAAAAEALLDIGDNLVDEIVLITARAGAVDVLVAADTHGAVREGDHDRRHALGDQAVQPLWHVLGERFPGGAEPQGAAR